MYESGKKTIQIFSPYNLQIKIYGRVQEKNNRGREGSAQRRSWKKEENIMLNVIILWHFESKQIFLKNKSAGRICRDYLALKQSIVSQK